MHALYKSLQKMKRWPFSSSFFYRQKQKTKTKKKKTKKKHRKGLKNELWQSDTPRTAGDNRFKR